MIKKFIKYNESLRDKMTPKDIKLSEIDEDEIKVYTDAIKGVFGKLVGEGIQDGEIIFDNDDKSVSWYYTEGIWGGTYLDEWNNVEDLLKFFSKEPAFVGYTINPSRNHVTIYFKDNYDLGEY